MRHIFPHPRTQVTSVDSDKRIFPRISFLGVSPIPFGLELCYKKVLNTTKLGRSERVRHVSCLKGRYETKTDSASFEFRLTHYPRKCLFVGVQSLLKVGSFPNIIRLPNPALENEVDTASLGFYLKRYFLKWERLSPIYLKALNSHAGIIEG